MMRYTYNRQVEPPAPFIHVSLKCLETGKSVDDLPALIDTAADRTVIPGGLVGLLELVPWLLQWHNEVDPEYDLRMGDYYRDFVRDEAQALGYTLDQVRDWTPPAKAHP